MKNSYMRLYAPWRNKGNLNKKLELRESLRYKKK